MGRSTMLDLYDELRALVSRLTEAQVEFALCGGLALAVHSVPRATVDIDLLVPVASLEGVKSVARSLGYRIEATPMVLGHGSVEIHRLSKPDPEGEDILSVDLLVVTPPLQEAWSSREEREWEHGRLPVVSRRGLILLKSLRAASATRRTSSASGRMRLKP
jgi:hypothetical protein